jgi:hypothetical protein
LTEESGPVLPPPRSSKRYPLESGFETVIRIDAGALGSGEADERRGAPGERGSDGEGRPPGESDKEKDTDPAKDGAGIGRSNEGDREERDDVSRARPGDGDASSGPVPIEAGVVIESPPADDGDGARDEPGDERRERETEAALTNVVGWQADPEQTDRADSEPKGKTATETRKRQPARRETAVTRVVTTERGRSGTGIATIRVARRPSGPGSRRSPARPKTTST